MLAQGICEVANYLGVVDHLEDVAVASMEDLAYASLMMMTSLQVFGAAVSTPVAIEGIVVGFEELPSVEEVGTRCGFFS